MATALLSSVELAGDICMQTLLKRALFFFFYKKGSA